MHALVRPVLLGGGRVNALMLDPQAHPPDVELRQPMDTTRREGHAVVSADRPREAELAEGVLEDRASAAALDRPQAAAGEQVAGVLVADRQGVAPHAVARGELALEIGGPEIVRGVGGRWHHAGVLMRPAAPALLDQACSDEEVPRRAHRGPRLRGDLGIPRREPVEQLAGAPIRMRAPRPAQQIGDRWRDAVRTVVGGMAPILQAAPSVLVVAGQPLVAGLAADGVPRAELRPRVEAAPIIGDEAFALVHG
jgi:hypothetical protein